MKSSTLIKVLKAASVLPASFAIYFWLYIAQGVYSGAIRLTTRSTDRLFVWAETPVAFAIATAILVVCAGILTWLSVALLRSE